MKKENKEINHPKSIIQYLIQGFFFSDLKMKSDTKYESNMNFQIDNQLQFSFYKQKVTDIYFVNSVIYK